MKCIHPYEDILACSRPISRSHPPMSMQDRAAQFAPFAALTGHQAAIQETARLTQSRIQLSEEARDQLDRKQRILLMHTEGSPQVAVTYFSPDARKEGGEYRVVTIHVKRVDPIRRMLQTEEGSDIPLDEIIDLNCDLFGSMDL